MIKWTPEDYYDARGYIIEVDFEPFGPSFEVDHQDYTDGSATQFILDNLPPLTRMRFFFFECELFHLFFFFFFLIRNFFFFFFFFFFGIRQ